MNKPFLLVLLLILCLSSCFTGFFDLGEEKLDGQNKPNGTKVQFDNRNNSVSVSIYSSPNRLTELDRIESGEQSTPLELFPNPNGIYFYLTFNISLQKLTGMTYTMPYIPDDLSKAVVEVSIPKDETTNVVIPLLTSIIETDEVLTDDVYLYIKNSGISGLRMRQSMTVITPVNQDTNLVNSGSEALYKVAAAVAANSYKIEFNGNDYPIPAEILSLGRGHLYSMEFDGTTAALLEDTLITLNNLQDYSEDTNE